MGLPRRRPQPACLPSGAARPSTPRPCPPPALQALGYECTQWVPAVYYDLLRLGDGTGPGEMSGAARRLRKLARLAAARLAAARCRRYHCLPPGGPAGLIRTFYDRMGWPRMLPSSERGAFVGKVYEAKCAALRAMAEKGEVPLREGVASFLDDALASGARCVVIAGTASAAEDSLVSSAMYQLGPSR